MPVRRVVLPPVVRDSLRPLAVLLLALAASLTVVVTISPGDQPAVQVTISKVVATTPTVTHVDTDGDGSRDDKVELSTAARVALAGAQESPELAAPLRAKDDRIGRLTGPLAADELPGCRTMFVRNFSNRSAVPGLIIWHQTVSRDRPGYADQDALTAQANNVRSGTSWNAQVGGTDGLCTYNVPLRYKAWTQANANSVSFGIEVQAYGDEPQYVTAKGAATLLRVTREIGRRYGIPMQRGAIRWGKNCTPIVVRRGILEHSDLGPCGGGHVDVTPWPTGWLVAKAAAASSSRARDRASTCSRLRYHRRQARRHGWTVERVRRVQALKKHAATVGLRASTCR